MKNIKTNYSHNTEFFKCKGELKDGYDKLVMDFSEIESSLTKLKKNIPSSYQNSISIIISKVFSIREYFKKYMSLISSNIQINNNNGSEPSSTTNSEFSKELTITPGIKTSYDMISTEFSKLEKITKSMIEYKVKEKSKRKKRILLLEKKLQNLCDTANNFDFNKVGKELENLNINNKEIISNYIMKRSDIEKYSIIDDSEIPQNYFSNNNSMSNESNSESSNEDNNSVNNNTIIQQILQMNPKKGEEMIELIETILSKSSSKAK